MQDNLQLFNQALFDWANVQQRRSMHSFILFTKKAGLSISQFGTLVRLCHTGSLGVSDIGRELGISNAAASQMVERLVQQGLLARTEDPIDRRSKQIALTPEGEKLVHESVMVRHRWMEDLAGAFSPEQQEQIAAALHLLVKAAGDTESKSPFECHNYRR